MNTLLNIGLARAGKKDLNSIQVMDFLEDITDNTISDFSVQQSSTEKTLVVCLPTAKVPDAFLHALSIVLGQDCIAALDGGKTGRLCGPKPWGNFDPSQFLDLKGGSL